LSEGVYAGALEHELRDRGHTVVRELIVLIYYKGRYVARQRLDMVVDNRIVVENMATERLSLADRSQLVSYLRATAFEVGLLLHFGPNPSFERYIDYPKHRRA
jgi:GxxExxY protein